MIDAAAGAHGVLLERAHQRCGLARIEDRDAARRRVDELAGQRGNAGHPLHEVERRALGGEQRRGTTVNLGDLHSGLAPRAVAVMHADA